jgi:hypothetical protein
MWKQRGRIIHTNGYVRVFMPNHYSAMKNGYVYEHRLIAESTLGRTLFPGEQIHHRDGDKTNNAPDNLEVIDIRAHASKHSRRRDDLRIDGAPNPVLLCGCGCGGEMERFDSRGRPRTFIHGHGRWMRVAS